MRSDLEHDICPKCYEWHDDKGKGLWWRMSHPCASTRHEYKILTGRAFIETFRQLFEEYKSPFEGLLEFEHLKAMPNYEEASWLERNCYSLARDMEIKQLKRMQAYLQLEEDLMYKY